MLHKLEQIYKRNVRLSKLRNSGNPLSLPPSIVPIFMLPGISYPKTTTIKTMVVINTIFIVSLDRSPSCLGIRLS